MRAIVRRLRWVVAAALIGGGVASAWWFVANRPMAVEVATTARDIPVRVFGLGTVEARIVAKIGFEVGAAITELRSDHGDVVRQGEVLARLHATEQEAKVARARAGMLSADVAVLKARANVDKARAILAQRQEVNRRRQALVGRNVISEQTAEEAKRDEEVARAELAVAVSEIEVAKAQLADAQANHEFERIILDHHTLTAPFDALVAERHRELGTVIKPGDPLFTLVAPDTVWVLAHVDESRAGPIVEGQTARLRLRSQPQRLFKGNVARIGIESDRVSEERRVYVRCEDCPARFHLGEQAEVFIDVAMLEQALLVPEAAVSRFDGIRGDVWMVRDGRLQRHSIRFRHRTEDARLEVADGLPEGARIVTSSDAGFREGRAVRIAATETR